MREFHRATPGPRSFRLQQAGTLAGLPERIIAACDADHPADKVLREQLKAKRDIMPSDARAVAQAVFNYFRWRGWLDLDAPLDQQIRKARELAANFAGNPESFSDASLVERVAPDWLREEMEITPAWARAIQAEPRLWLRSRRGQGTALCEKLGAAKLEKTLLPDAIHYKGEEDLFKRPEFHAGEFEIQDIASQVVGLLCDPQPGETWWDACAGEGGKTLHLSDLDAEQRPDLGERPRGMASDKTQAPRRPRQSFQLSRRALGRWREAADENQIRRRAGGCAVQRRRNLAAQSACALDDDVERREGTVAQSKRIAGQRRAQREAGRQIDFLRLHADTLGDDGGGGGILTQDLRRSLSRWICRRFRKVRASSRRLQQNSSGRRIWAATECSSPAGGGENSSGLF